MLCPHANTKTIRALELCQGSKQSSCCVQPSCILVQAGSGPTAVAASPEMAPGGTRERLSPLCAASPRVGCTSTGF